MKMKEKKKGVGYVLDSSADRFIQIVLGMLLLGIAITAGWMMFGPEKADPINEHFDATAVGYVHEGTYRMKTGTYANRSVSIIPLAGGGVMPLSSTSNSSEGPFVAFYKIDTMDNHVLAIAEFTDERVILDVLPSELVSFDGKKYPYFKAVPDEDERNELRESVVSNLDFGTRDVFFFDMTHHIER